MAGHEGKPAEVAKAGRIGRRRRLKSHRSRGTLAEDKPPIWGRIQRQGDHALRTFLNVQQATIQPVIPQTVQPGNLIYTDKCGMYSRGPRWAYAHKAVKHAQGE